MSGSKSVFLGFVAAITVLTTGGPAFAANEDQLETVTVTARKTEESVQEVPVAIAALSAEVIDQQVILDVRDLPSAVPGLFVSTNSQGGAPTFAIRAAKAANGTADTVTAYIGDMPVTTTRAIANMVYDMDSISVLKGPQGTLFGANSTGGAIIFRPKTPGQEFEAYLEAGFGDFSRKTLQGMVNVPISDAVQLRVAGEWVDRDEGFQKNLLPVNGNDDIWTDKHESARVSLRIAPSERVTNDLMVAYFHQDDQQIQETPIALRGPFTANGLSVNYALFNISPSSDFNSPVRIGPEPTWNKAKIYEVTNAFTFNASDSTSFKLALGYEKAELDTFQDNDGTRLAIVNGRTTHDNKQYTIEPSIDTKFKDGRLRWKFGLYYADLKRETGNSYSVLGLPYDPASPLFAVISPNFPVQSNSFYVRETKSKAAYTQLSYDVNDQLTATFGIRYTEDDGDYVAQNRLGFGLNTTTGVTAVGGARFGDFITGLCSALPVLGMAGLETYRNFNLAACTGEQNISSSAPSFNLTLENKLSDSTMLYATLRGGYLVGGFNNQVFVAGNFGQTFEPEKVTDVEMGLKSDWNWGGKPTRTNLDLFYGNYKNQQRVQNGQAGGLTFIAVQNAGASTFYGFDFDGLIELTDHFELKLGWNHLETEYTKFFAALNIPNVIASVDLAGQEMSQAPKDQLSLAATVKWPIADTAGSISSTLSAYYTSKTSGNDSPTYGCTPNAAGLCTGPSSAAVDFRQFDGLPSYTLLNFSTEWKNISGSNFSASLWVKNLTDEDYFAAVSNQMLQYGYATRYYGPPRTYGVSLRYDFGSK